MKRIFIFIICAFSYPAFAQNFGIDQPNPTEKLDVNGNIKASGSISIGTIYGPQKMMGTLGSFDTRSTNPTPETYQMGVVNEFKSNSAIGISDGGNFSSVLSIRQWNSGTDWSGGGVHQLAFTQNGNIQHRYSQTTGSWGSWQKISNEPDYDSGWFADNTSSGHTTTLNHNLGVIPTRYEIFFSPTNPPSGFIYPVSVYGMSVNKAISQGLGYRTPAAFRLSSSQVAYNTYTDTYLYSAYDQNVGWSVWTAGFYRILLWK